MADATEPSSAGDFTIESVHIGKLFYDSPKDNFLIRSKSELAEAKACVADKAPKYVPGVMKTDGYVSRSDPMLDGSLKDGVDFNKQSIIVVGGRQCVIARVEATAAGVKVHCTFDESQTHGREYCAAVVEPPVPVDAEMEVEVIGDVPPMMQSAVVEMPFAMDEM